jgi:tetratricopeptide (TPR) repeat protein
MKSTLKTTSFIVLLLISCDLYVTGQARDRNAEQKIEDQLYALDPTLVYLFKTATIEMDQNNHRTADSLYSLVLQKVPTFDPVLRRIGSIRCGLGKIEEGISFSQKAVDINRSAYNLLTLANCLLQPGQFQDMDKALKLLTEARQLPDGDDIYIISLIGQIQLQNSSLDEFRNTTAEMMKTHPDEMVTHYFSAIQSAQDKNWITAKEQILIAKELGLSDDAVQEFLDSGVETHNKIRIFSAYFLWVFLVWSFGLILLYVIGKILSGIIMKSIDNSNKINSISERIRSVYKWLINIGGVYYYFSLPIILALVIILVIGLFYIFLMIGRIPIKLMLILAGGALVTIYSMIRSLLLKTKYTDPGRELRQEEAPGLFNLVGEVAHSLKTRTIDEVRITYGTDLAVYENGTWKQKQQDKARRILILGAGIIGDFKKGDFRAVLAHEYGHFSHRDTAGGNIALKVRNDMNKYLIALYTAGQNVWWNLAFQFLRTYNFIFRRISFGSTRLQEILADKVAAQTYGIIAFKNGLTYVIKRDIEFSELIDKNVEEIRNARPSINIYDSSDLKPGNEELEKILNRKTTEDDTHPSPVDRFRFISQVDSPFITEDNSLLKDLFVNWESIEQEMRSLIDKQIADGL